MFQLHSAASLKLQVPLFCHAPSWSVEECPSFLGFDNRNCHFPYLLSTHRNHTFLGEPFSEPEMHTSHLSTGAIKCIPAAIVAIWWQAVGGGEDESCQWQPLKRTTHSPVTGKTWWMIISRCDRCCDGGGALALSFPVLPLSLSLRLSPPLSLYLGQCFNTPLTWLYWHTPDSVWSLMSVWVPLLLSLSLCFFFLCAPHLPVILFSLSEPYSQFYLTHKAIRAWLAAHTNAYIRIQFKTRYPQREQY